MKWQTSARFAFLAAAATLAAAAAKPNIVFFMADDTGWYNVGWHNPDMKTPNANALVKAGVELDRHYAFVYCSPSRTSLMTGRLPYHAQQINYGNADIGQGAPDNMTFISAKLKSAGYMTYQVGKWHLGCYSMRQTPMGRGFDESLVYFAGAQDHYSQRSCADPECIIPIAANATSSPHDFWANDMPATDLAGTRYSGYIFNDHAVEFVNKNAGGDKPLFMYVAADNAHVPLEVPDEWLDLYPADWYRDRRLFAGMCSFWDSLLGNVTSALKAKPGVWDNTLLVVSSDNGGPAYWSTSPSFPHGAGGNNWPLRGSKVTSWEGGIRVAAFVAGGFLPENARGRKIENFIVMSDWYATFCNLADIDPADAVAAAHGLPPIDSADLWPLLVGSNTTSPHTTLPIVVDFVPPQLKAVIGNSSAILHSDRWKLLEGTQLLSYWQGPAFPNASGYGRYFQPFHACSPACLYDIVADPGEHNDLAKQLFQKMLDCGVRPNVVAYTSLARCFAHKGDWQEVEDISEEMAARGLATNEFFLYALLIAYGAARPRRQTDKAEAAFLSAAARGVPMNQHIVGALARCLGRNRCNELARQVGIVLDHEGNFVSAPPSAKNTTRRK